ncbi:hypothetical protein ABK040_008916 [Willaertia magna]
MSEQQQLTESVSSTITTEVSNNNITNDNNILTLTSFLEKLKTTISDNNNSLNIWEIIQTICTLLKDKKQDDEVLAISSIKTSIELIVVWGILPRLLKGVGISISKRIATFSQHAKLIIEKQVELTEKEKHSKDEINKLVKCIKTLIEIMEWNDFYKTVILQNYLIDVFAAFFQILFISHQYKKQFQKELIPEEDYKFCTQQLFNLLTNTNESLIVTSLLTLLSQPIIPQWLQLRCTTWLSKTIIRPKGVHAIITSMLDNISESSTTRAYDKVVQLILTKPKDISTIEEYYSIISNQLIKLFHIRGKKSPQLLKVVALCCGKMIEKEPTLAKQFIMDPILEPLKRFITLQKQTEEEAFIKISGFNSSNSNNKKEKKNKLLIDDDYNEEVTIRPLNENGEEEVDEETLIICDETELGQCIEDIHRLLFGNTPASFMFNTITPIIPALFQLYCFVSKTKLFLKSACEEIMTSYFKISDDALDVTKRLLIFDRKLISGKSFVTFCPGESGGVCIKKVSETKRDCLWEAQCMINLFKLMKNHTVAGDLFVHLITQFTFMKQHLIEQDLKMKEEGLGILNEASLPEGAIILLQVINLLISEMGASIMKNTSQTISFIKFLLLNNEHSIDEESLESLMMALGILSTILCGSIPVRTVEEEEKLQDLKPILERIKSHKDQQIAEMASTALLSIDTKEYRKIHTDVKEYSEEEKIKVKFDSILQDLRDPLLPVRAHGVFALRDLVLENKKNELVHAQLKNIFNILQAQLKDDDSYIYYGAIGGLSTLGDVYPDEIIPILVDSFGNKKQPIEERLKIGESLVEIAERCGQTLPKYAHYFVYCFLNCGKENDEDYELLRASALSNMATLVEILKFGVHPYIQDILDCCSYVLTFDESEHVRRAAILIFDRLVKTFKIEIFDLFNDVTSSKLTELLKRVAFYDNDDLVKINANAIISELDDLLQKRLTPSGPYIPGGDKDHFLNNFLKLLH